MVIHILCLQKALLQGRRTALGLEKLRLGQAVQRGRAAPAEAAPELQAGVEGQREPEGEAEAPINVIVTLTNTIIIITLTYSNPFHQG